ncbi:MAG: CHAT domain-containing protein [Acidobacteriota bacterium]
MAILGTEPKQTAVVLARCGTDMAIENLPIGQELRDLLSFRDHVDQSLHSLKDRPLEVDLAKFGNDLFKYVIRGDVERIYYGLPTDALVRLNILSNSQELQSIPWEYMQDPKQPAGPWVVRSVVRIIPTVGSNPPNPLPLATLNRKLKILFAFADPVDQDPVSWSDVKDAVERALQAGIPANNYELKVIDANPKALAEALQETQYDIFHFSGHGVVDENGVGQVLLMDRTGNRSIPYSAAKLSMILRSRGIRLVILSACYTSSGNYTDKFDVTAIALIGAGIPAVVANQFPVPDSTVATFVKPLYDSLFKNGDIDLAVNEARYLLANDPALTQGAFATLEWGIPTLYRHVAGSLILKP